MSIFDQRIHQQIHHIFYFQIFIININSNLFHQHLEYLTSIKLQLYKGIYKIYFRSENM
jgi:hypothetical protein